MTKFGKLMAGLLLGVALFTSSIVPAQAQSSLTYVSRQAFHITAAGTTVAQSSDAYVVSIVVTVTTAGTLLLVRNKEGTPKVLMNQSIAAAGTFTVLLGSKDAAIYSKSGIDIVVTGTPTMDVFITSYKP